MDPADLIPRLMRTFLGEFEEHLRTLEARVLELEADDGAPGERLRELFRAAHSLKGAARAVNLAPVELVAHELETVFGRMDPARKADADALQAVLGVVDTLRAAAAGLRAERPLEEAPLAAATRALAGLRPGADATLASRPPSPPSPSRPQAPAPAPAPASTPMPAPEAHPDSEIRVGVDRLDRMLDMAGELLVARRQAASRPPELEALMDELRQCERVSARSGSFADAVDREQLQRWRRRLGEIAERLRSDQRHLEQAASPLEREILKTRMLPFSQLCEGMGRSLRDLAHGAGKRVVLQVRGGDIEIDRGMAAGLREALQHLLRNAVAHGIEPERVRKANGKPGTGTVSLSAQLSGGRIEVRVEDDGGGFDLDGLRRRAAELGLEVPEDAAAAAALAFEPGLSTSDSLDLVSGRGVGLDAARSAVEALRGRIEARSRAGAGTTFILSLPLSLGMLPALVVAAGGQLFAFDGSTVVGLRHVRPADLGAAEGRDVLALPDRTVPVVELAMLVGARRRDVPAPPERLPAVLLGAGDAELAVLVDELVAEMPLVVKDLGPRLRKLRRISGGALLGDGRIALILEARALIDAATGRRDGPSLRERLATTDAGERKRLLVVDDSVTTRALVQGLLEAAGYEVLAAADGMEAWNLLQDQGVDLVVSDVEMPRMDGIALAEAIRASRRLRQLPVVLVTALESEQDRRRGLEAGADAYLVKSAFDQTELLQVIGQIL